MARNVRIEVMHRDGDRLHELARDFRKAGSTGKELRKRLRRNIKVPMVQMQNAVKGAIRAIPSKRKREGANKATGLRARMARGVKVRIRMSGKDVGVRLEVDTPSLRGSEENLPALMEGLGKWRHPTFGKSPWVTQDPHPYFWVTVKPRLPAVRRAIRAALDETARELEEGT